MVAGKAHRNCIGLVVVAFVLVVQVSVDSFDTQLDTHFDPLEEDILDKLDDRNLDVVDNCLQKDLK